MNRFYYALPGIVQEVVERFATATGRTYRLFEYQGHPQAERVVVAMGSAIETLAETAAWMAARGEKVGVLAVRLFLPFHLKSFLAALPPRVKAMEVLDRTKEPGSLGEPLHLNVLAALVEGRSPLAGSARDVGGRYGLGSKECTPGMAKAVFDHLTGWEPRNHATVAGKLVSHEKKDERYRERSGRANTGGRVLPRGSPGRTAESDFLGGRAGRLGDTPPEDVCLLERTSFGNSR